MGRINFVPCDICNCPDVCNEFGCDGKSFFESVTHLYGNVDPEEDDDQINPEIEKAELLDT